MLRSDTTLSRGSVGVYAADASNELLVISTSTQQRLLFFSCTKDFMRLIGESAVLPVVVSAVKISPCGLLLAVGDVSGRVVVHRLDNTCTLNETGIMTQHKQHGHSCVSTLCWSVDSTRVFSGSKDGLVIELSVPTTATAIPPRNISSTSTSLGSSFEQRLLPLQLLPRSMSELTGSLSKLGMFASLLQGSTVVCHTEGEEVLQICACDSEISCGLTDLVLVSTSKPQILLFHFPRNKALDPRSSDVTQGLKLPPGRTQAEFSYSCCFSSARLASAIVVCRCSRLGCMAVYFCNTNGVALQEFPIADATHLDQHAPLSVANIRAMRSLQKNSTHPNLLLGVGTGTGTGTGTGGEGYCVVLLLDLARMASQTLLPLSPSRGAGSAFLLDGGVLALQDCGPGLRACSLAFLHPASQLPLRILSVYAVDVIRVLQRIFRLRLQLRQHARERSMADSIASSGSLADNTEEDSQSQQSQSFSWLQDAAGDDDDGNSISNTIGGGVRSVGSDGRGAAAVSVCVACLPAAPAGSPSYLTPTPSSLEAALLSVAALRAAACYCITVNASRGLGVAFAVGGDLRLTVQRFNRMAGGRGPVELDGRVAVGDTLLAIDGIELATLGIEQAIAALRSLELAAEDVVLTFEYGDAGAPAWADSSTAAESGPSRRRRSTAADLFDVFGGIEGGSNAGDLSVPSSLSGEVAAEVAPVGEHKVVMAGTADETRREIAARALFPCAAPVTFLGATAGSQTAVVDVSSLGLEVRRLVLQQREAGTARYFRYTGNTSSLLLTSR